MGNGNGEPAALWEVCRAFKGLKKNSMCATGLKKARKKSNQTNILLCPRLLLLGMYLPKSASEVEILFSARDCRLSQQSWSQPSKIVTGFKQTNPSLACKWKNSPCTQHRKWQILKKRKKLYSILHRISSIWACFGSCYHTELPWYLGRFIKMVTKDGRNVKPCRVSHLPLRNTPLCGQNAAPLQHCICGRMVGHQS